MSALLSLAGRCEEATGADRELDEAIAKAIGVASLFAAGNRDWHFTASLDAALSLVPAGWRHKWNGIDCNLQLLSRPRFQHGWEIVSEAECSDEGRALVAACLRARAAMEGDAS
jgi:hypothetical protein